MRDYINIGPTPSDEPCQQVGTPNYNPALARGECYRFIDAIRQKLGPEPEGARLAVKTESHDFGSYMEVVCYFEDTNEASIDYAFKCEAEAPTTWPEEVAA